MKARQLLLVPLLLLAAHSGAGDALSAQERGARFAVIVNAQNVLDTDADSARAQVRKLYLKEATEWSNGVVALPFGREASSAAQTAFLERVLGMSQAALARHWIKLKNLRGVSSPKQVESAALVRRYVVKYPGAFGIVPIEEASGDDIRILFEF